jgi:hypothetical protein
MTRASYGNRAAVGIAKQGLFLTKAIILKARPRAGKARGGGGLGCENTLERGTPAAKPDGQKGMPPGISKPNHRFHGFPRMETYYNKRIGNPCPPF